MDRDTAERVVFWPADKDAGAARTGYYWGGDAPRLVAVTQGAPLTLRFADPAAVPDADALAQRLNAMVARELPPALVPADHEQRQWVLRTEHATRAPAGGDALSLWVAHHAAHAVMARRLLPFRVPPSGAPASASTVWVDQVACPVHVRQGVRARDGTLLDTVVLSPPRSRDDAALLWDDGSAPHRAFVPAAGAAPTVQDVWIEGTAAGPMRVPQVSVFAAHAGAWLARLASHDGPAAPPTLAEMRDRARKDQARARRETERLDEARKRPRTQPSLAEVWHRRKGPE